MKKILGLLIVITLSGISAVTLAQSKQGSEKAKTEQPADKETVNETTVAKPAPNTSSKPAPTTISKPAPVKAEPVITKPAPVAKPKTETAEDNVKPVKNNSKKDKRMHAEERSKGHAFSGKGKGGDKNIIDPVKKNKKQKAKKGKIKKEKMK